MAYKNISSAEELLEVIKQIGFMPLLPCAVPGFSVEEMVDDECRYHVFDDGGWDWPMWKWKGPIVELGEVTYGKFFGGKAGYVSMDWWRCFSSYRRHAAPALSQDSIEMMILDNLRLLGSAITKDLRQACGFNGKNMRSKFDSYVTRLEMQCRIVTENFVYPHDKHGREYGWGWSLLTTPERLFSQDYCLNPTDNNGQEQSADELLELMLRHLSRQLPAASEKQLLRLLSYNSK